MALIIRSTDQTTTDTISNGDDYILREGVLLSNDVNTALSFNTVGGSYAQIAGMIAVSGGARALQVFSTSQNVTVGILPTGSLSASNVAVSLEGANWIADNAGSISGGQGASGYGVQVGGTGTGGVFTNSGAVTGKFGFAVFADDTAITNIGTITAVLDAVFTGTSVDDLSVNNSGTMRAGESALVLNGTSSAVINSGSMSGGNNGIFSGTNGNDIVNSGTLEGGNFGILLSGAGSGVATQIQNLGVITGTDVGLRSGQEVNLTSSGALLGARGIHLNDGADNSLVSNDGRIDGDLLGIDIDVGADNVTVGNQGVITAATFGILSDAVNTRVTNSGAIETGSLGSAVYFAEGGMLTNSGTLTGQNAVTFLASGTVVNSGEISGSISLGSGADRVTNTNTGVLNSDVNMGAGTDTVVNAGRITGTLTNAEVVSNSGTLEMGASLTGSGAQMTNSGEILSQMGVALTLTGNEAEVLNTGVITGDVNVIGNTAHLSNSGDVLGDILLEGEGFNILNTGTVLATGFAISAGLTGTGGNQITNDGTLSGNLGIGIFGDQSSVTNTGTITAISNEGIYIEGSGIVISNTGDIHARGDGVTTVNLGSRLVNDGTIVSTSGDAVAGIQYMFNTGVISGQNLGYLGSSEADSLRNSGEINGTVSLGLGADRVVNWGKISDSSGFAIDMGTGTEADVVVNWGLIDGSVIFDAGADLYHGRGDGVVQGTVIGGGGMDTLRGSALDDSFDGGTDNDVLLGDGGDDTLLGDAGEDTVMGGAGADNIEGGNDNDRLFGGADNDVIFGGFGHDQLSGDMGDDTLSGDIGNDTLTGGSGNDAVDGGGGADLLYGNMGDDSIFGGSNAFSDTLYGGSGDDTLDGGDGVDFLYGGANDDRLIGGTNNDVLNGDWGNDTLIGGGGLDTINGGTGDDVLSGGANPDTFVFDRLNSGDDRITDFTNGLDLIDLQALGLSGYADLTGAGAVSSFDSGASTLIDLSLVGGDGTILMDGFAFANLNAADFVF